MEEAIDIAMIEEQSYNSATATAYYKPSDEKSDDTPMELGDADVVCYKCGNRGHMMTRFFAKLAVGSRTPRKKDSLTEGWCDEPACTKPGVSTCH